MSDGEGLFAVKDFLAHKAMATRERGECDTWGRGGHRDWGGMREKSVFFI